MRKIGIDFGTCNIKGAEKKKNGDITYVKLGKAIDKVRIPNVIIYEKKEDDYTVSIGDVALKKAVPEQDRIRCIKSYLQEEGWKRELSFGKVVNAFDVTLDIMKCLYEEIHNTNKREELSATITVPVNFSKRQQMIVESAAAQAGFHVDAVITEPFASLFFLMQDNFEDEDGHKVLIYDFGGGTLDLCLADIKCMDSGIRVEVQSTVGISYGGNHINEDILENILKKRFPEEIDNALYKQENIFRGVVNRYYIMETIDGIKAELFEEDQIEETKSAEILPRLFDGSVIDLGDISAADIYGMLREQRWNERLFHLLDRLFDDSDLIQTEITDAFVTGGSSSIPFFRNVIADYFIKYGHKNVDTLFKLNNSMDREERLYTSVAAGAAIYDELLEAEEIEIRDKIPFMIYTKDENGKKCSKLRKDDYYKDYSSALAPVTEWMKENKKIGIFQTIFGEQEKEVFLGDIALDEEMLRDATLYRLTVDRKRTIRMELGYLLDDDLDGPGDGFCREWCVELLIEI